MANKCAFTSHSANLILKAVYCTFTHVLQSLGLPSLAKRTLMAPLRGDSCYAGLKTYQPASYVSMSPRRLSACSSENLQMYSFLRDGGAKRLVR